MSLKFLDKIIAVKEREITQLKTKRPSLARSLREEGLSLIAEIKRSSPSEGTLAAIQNPLKLLRSYEEGGAAAISVLTEKQYFNGSLEDLRLIAQNTQLPVLRKDFLLSPLQIVESAEAGASAVLLIVKLLGERTGKMLEYTYAMGLEALVEVQNLPELNIAIQAGAKVVVVNNRNLDSLEVDLNTSAILRSEIPEDCICVSASGIFNEYDAQRMQDLAYDGILVGQGLVQSQDPKKQISVLRKGVEKSCA